MDIYLGDSVQQISRSIRNMIKSIAPGKKLPSQSELVSMFKCSHTTVHKAMNSLVREGLIVRKVGLGTFVREQEKFLNSSKNIAIGVEENCLSAPLAKRVLICSIVSENIPSLRSPAFEILAYAEREIHSLTKGCSRIFFSQVKNPADIESDFVKFAPEGAIVGWQSPEESRIVPLWLESFFYKHKIPIIHCFHFCRYEYPLRRIVTLDNARIGSMVLSHLSSLGHKNILMISVASEDKVYGFENDRIVAAEDYASEFGLNLSVYRYGAKNSKDIWFDAGLAAYHHFEEIPILSRPTAIFAINDKIAASFLSEAIKDGLKIPDDFSIVGVDNELDIYLQCGVNLTSVDPCRGDVGRKAAKWLFQILSGEEKEDDDFRIIRSAPKLILRESCAALRTKIIV